MDADYDVSLDFPLDLDEDVTLCLQTIVSVMNYVTIWITRDIINFLSLYTIMYTLFIGLLCHVYGRLYCIWSNAFLC